MLSVSIHGKRERPKREEQRESSAGNVCHKTLKESKISSIKENAFWLVTIQCMRRGFFASAIGVHYKKACLHFF